jgi:hypothetical protein
MFGRWKRRYEEAVGLCHDLADESDKWRRLANERSVSNKTLIDEVVKLRREIREAKAQLAAADFPLEAERAENERLRARLKTTVDERNAAKGQSIETLADLIQSKEATINALEQRDAAIKERDEWREVAESASTVTARVFALCRGFITDLSRLKEIADAPSEPDPADDRPQLDAESGVRFRVGCIVHESGPADGLQPDAEPDHAAVQGDGPDFIRFPGFADPDTDPDAA